MPPVHSVEEERVYEHENENKNEAYNITSKPTKSESLDWIYDEVNNEKHSIEPSDNENENNDNTSPTEITRTLAARSTSTGSKTYAPGVGAINPDSIHNGGLLALFALLGTAFAIAAIWFFFWAKNGGCVWRKGDWDDYKSTVLRRKGPDGRTLTNATKSTDLGQGSIAGKGFGYSDRDGLTNTFYTDETRTVDDEKTEASGRRREPKWRRKIRETAQNKILRRNKEKQPWEGEADEDVQAYRNEKPARVGGINRLPDGTYHGSDYDSSYFSHHNKSDMTEVRDYAYETATGYGDGHRYDDYGGYAGTAPSVTETTPTANAHSQRRDFSFVPEYDQRRDFSFVPEAEDITTTRNDPSETERLHDPSPRTSSSPNRNNDDNHRPNNRRRDREQRRRERRKERRDYEYLADRERDEARERNRESSPRQHHRDHHRHRHHHHHRRHRDSPTATATSSGSGSAAHRSVPGGGHYTEPLDFTSSSNSAPSKRSNYQYSSVGGTENDTFNGTDNDTDKGTKSYHHPIPGLSRGYRRDRDGGGRSRRVRRRDSLSDSD